MVQWLGLCASTAGGLVAWIQSLIGEVRVCQPHSKAKSQTKIALATVWSLDGKGQEGE